MSTVKDEGPVSVRQIIIGVTLMVASCVLGSEPWSPSSFSDADRDSDRTNRVNKLIADLGAADTQARKLAEDTLKEYSRAVLPLLERHENSVDSEVSRRIREITKYIRENPALVPQRFLAFDLPADNFRGKYSGQWYNAFNEWRKTAVVSTGHMKGNGMTGVGMAQSFIPHCNSIKAVIMQVYPIGGPAGWLRFEICEDDNGLPRKFVLSRTWLLIDNNCPVPRFGFTVFDMGNLSVVSNKTYWFRIKGYGAPVNCIDGCTFPEGKTLAGGFTPCALSPNFQIISACAPCALFRTATEEEKKSLPDVKKIPFDWKTSRDDEPMTWEEALNILGSGFTSHLVFSKGRFDVETLTQEQKDFLRQHFKKAKVPPGYRMIVCEYEWAMLIRLHDEEIVKFLLGELPKNPGPCQDAASTLATAAEPWVLPLLEPYVFWDPKNDRRGFVEDVGYETISQTTIGTCYQIVKRSRAFNSKTKAWFELLMTLSWGKREELRAILREWWDINRRAMQEGKYQELQIVPLWKASGKNQTAAITTSFSKDDYLDALASPYPTVRQAAGRKIAGECLSLLGKDDLPRLAAVFRNPGSDMREAVAEVIAKQGQDGWQILQEAFQQPERNIRRCAAANLLRFSQPVSKEKREFYLKEIGDDLGCLRAFLPPDEFFAKIKQIVLDKSRSGKERAGPLWQFILSPPLKAEPAFIDSLLSPEFPTEVRELALLIAAHYSKPAKVPEAVLQLRSDPDDRIRYRVYECMGMLWQESYWKQFAEGLQDKAPSVVKECAVRLGVKDGRRSIPLLVAFLESAITRDAAWEEARLAACEQIVRIAQNCKIPSQPVYPEPATRPKEFSLLWAQSILAWWKACGAAEFGR